MIFLNSEKAESLVTIPNKEGITREDITKHKISVDSASVEDKTKNIIIYIAKRTRSEIKTATAIYS